jgi:hypothetical protein
LKTSETFEAADWRISAKAGDDPRGRGRIETRLETAAQATQKVSAVKGNAGKPHELNQRVDA